APIYTREYCKVYLFWQNSVFDKTPENAYQFPRRNVLSCTHGYGHTTHKIRSSSSHERSVAQWDKVQPLKTRNNHRRTYSKPLADAGYRFRREVHSNGFAVSDGCWLIDQPTVCHSGYS